MRILFTGILVGLLFFTSLAEIKISKKEKGEINSLLDKQVVAWNAGNLEKFMETYWNSEKLSFVGSRGPTYGWQATLDRYKKGYPNKAAMGKLKFTILNISKIDKKTVLVIGKFELAREIGDLSGHYTLVIQKIKNEWLIVSDHSSAEN
ncbi:MAG: nuclear transport factor 2 family protein [Bacteroidetes bacterium]|nr:nuclear transport factor 2 family protein [Bacteroidota bacterium]